MNIGILKREYAYDLNAASYSLNTSTVKLGVAYRVAWISFWFSSVSKKTISITLQEVYDGVIYTIQRWTHIATDNQWFWANPLDCPASLNIVIEVSQTADPCSMNMVIATR